MGKWVREISPRDAIEDCDARGWFGELDRVYRQDRKYVVLSRMIKTQIGVVEHLCIRNDDNTDIPWREKQRIKNELAGRNRTAIEVYPKESRLIDEANMYHLWVLPEEYELPFGIHTDDTSTEPVRRELMIKK